MQEVAPIIMGAGIIVFLAHLFTGIFNRLRIPDVLFLIAIGVVVGPITGLMPASALGPVGSIFATVTLIIILFEYGITLNIYSLRHAVTGAISLAVISFLLTMIVVTGLVFWLTDLGFLPSLILGAIIGSTSEAIVIPLVRQLKIRETSQALLSVESSISAVLSILISITFIEVVKLGHFEVLPIAGNLLASFSVAICLGIGGAYLWAIVLNKVRLLKNATFTTAAFVFVIFGVVEILGFSGAIAALVFGIALGNLSSIALPFLRSQSNNRPTELTHLEKNFFSEIAFLFKTFFFVYLGMSLEMISNQLIILAAVFTAIILLLRLIASKLSLSKKYTVKDISLIAVMVPRGLTAIILASIPFQQGIIGGDTIKNLTYGIVLFSIVLTSILVLLLDRTKTSALFGYLFSANILSESAEKSPE